MKDFIIKTAAVISVISLLIFPANAAGEYSEADMEMDMGEVDEAIFLEDDTDYTAAIDVAAPSAILMEKETGTVIYEKNADERLLPASVTKVMTILLIIEAVEIGRISLDDMITTSAYAASMGGSQVYLEEGEQMALREMLKCIVVSSANDAAVAVAEHIAGSEQAFAELMNEKAASLGMENSHFTNCTGLLDSDEHYTSARDIAIMSAEVIKYDWIKEYTTIWMDSIRGGEFGLSNTNKMIRFYEGATGLKTGYTSKAGHCLAATAERDGMELIAVVLNCDSSNNRFESAKIMLNYGFANYTLVEKLAGDEQLSVPVKLGAEDTVNAVLNESGKLLVRRNAAPSITRTVTLEPEVTAPVEEGQKLGTLTISDGTNTIAELDLVAEAEVAALTWWDVFSRMLSTVFFGTEQR